MNKLQEYTNFRSGLYNLVMGQCSEALKERLKSHEDFMDANQNGIALLVLICSLLHTFEEHRKLADGLSDVKMAFYKLRQGKYMKLERYHELFLAQVEVMDEVGVTIPDTALIQHVAEQHGRGVPTAAVQAEAKQIALAIQFIKGTNASHKPYLSHLRNSYLDGLDVYPNTVQEAYNILQCREETHNVPTVDCTTKREGHVDSDMLQLLTDRPLHKLTGMPKLQCRPLWTDTNRRATRGRWRERPDVQLLSDQRGNSENVGFAGQSIDGGHLLQPSLVAEYTKNIRRNENPLQRWKSSH